MVDNAGLKASTVCLSPRVYLRYTLDYGSIFECRKCGHATVGLHDATAAADANARAFDRSGAFVESEIDTYRSWARERLTLFSGMLKPGSRLLEFGPGGGEFLWEATKAGYQVDAVDRFDRILDSNRPSSTHVIKSDVESFHGNGQYDGVAAFHLLEHSVNPDRALAMMRSALRRSGLLVVEVPNYSSSGRRLQGRGWGCFEPYHVQYFTPQSLALLCEHSRFKVKSITSCGAGGLEETAGRIVARGIPAMTASRHSGRSINRDTSRPAAPLDRRARRWQQFQRRLYWCTVAAARFPFLPVSAVERRWLLAGNLRIVAERTDA